jgi:hypothetical protein
VHPGTAIYIGYTDYRANLSFDPENPTGLSRIAVPAFPTGRSSSLELAICSAATESGVAKVAIKLLAALGRLD